MMAVRSRLGTLVPELALYLVEIADAHTAILLASSCRRWRHLICSNPEDVTHNESQFAKYYRRYYPGYNYGSEAELLSFIWLELKKAGLPPSWLLALCARQAIGRRWRTPTCGQPFPPPMGAVKKSLNQPDASAAALRSSLNAVLSLLEVPNTLSNNENSTSSTNYSDDDTPEINVASNASSMELSHDPSSAQSLSSIITNEAGESIIFYDTMRWLQNRSLVNSTANSSNISVTSITSERCRRPTFVSVGHIGLRNGTGVQIYDRINDKKWHLQFPYGVESSLSWGGVGGQRTAQHFLFDNQDQVRIWSLLDGSLRWYDVKASRLRWRTILRPDVLYTWSASPLTIECWNIAELDKNAPTISSTRLDTQPTYLNEPINLCVPYYDGTAVFLASEVAPGLSCALITPNLPETEISDLATALMHGLTSTDAPTGYTASEDIITNIFVWDLNKPRVIRRIVEPQQFSAHLGRPKDGPSACSEFTNDALVVWSSYYELHQYSARDIARIACYAPSTGKERWSICLSNRFVNNVVTSVWQNRVAAIGDEELLLLSLRDGTVLHTLTVNYRPQIQFGLEGLLICSNRSDTTLVAIDIYTGQIHWTLKALEDWQNIGPVWSMDVYTTAGRILLYLPHHKLAQEIDFINSRTTTTSGCN
ncbi:hypothetical protein BDF19DRAFT_494110 [Syncephalis fuscata]|nr:hypothetical protein BDF19DRAFT_494110 [Syncephalis fuscata]